MLYKTRTYIAADWTGDKEVIDKLREWNDSGWYALDFSDAHDLTQARDTSLPCSIKKSLATRLNGSKNFVLIVGKETKNLTKGACRYCSAYISTWGICYNGHSVDQRSYIQYECEKAIKDGMKIVVIYNYANVDKSKCPECIKDYGVHIPAYFRAIDGKFYWNISEITKAING